jgi:lysophospholipase L1-like esterase
MKGGFSYIERKIDAKSQQYPESYYERKNRLNALPETERSIVFIGNSIIEQCEWHELLQNPRVVNRGIGNDDLEGLFNRLNPIIETEPNIIFLYIGLNDLKNGLNRDKFKFKFSKIIKNIGNKSPKTKIYAFSILPTDNKTRKNKDIINANRLIKEICKKNCNYLDFYHAFLDDKGKIKPKYTTDGLHLSGAGYAKLKELIKKYIE